MLEIQWDVGKTKFLAFTEPTYQPEKWTGIKKINKIISDSDVCYEEHMVDHGREHCSRGSPG